MGIKDHFKQYKKRWIYKRRLLASLSGSEKSWFNFSTILSIVAILLSGLSLYVSKKQYAEDLESLYIQNTYTTFFAVDKMNIENPNASHLFCLREDYDSIKKNVHNSFAGDTGSDVNLAILKERALAMHIFDYYEEITFKIRHAEKFNDQAQKKFLIDEMDYFLRLLQNQRLKYYWKKMAFYYDPRTIIHYNYNDSMLSVKERLVLDEKLKLKYAMDSIGPYIK